VFANAKVGSSPISWSLTFLSCPTITRTSPSGVFALIRLNG
jgi:hypothetical protein